MGQANRRRHSGKCKANRKVDKPKRVNETSSNHGLALSLIELARAGKEGLPPAQSSFMNSNRACSSRLAELGVLTELNDEGKIQLIDGPENFEKVFLKCDREGRANELINSDYALMNIGEPLVLGSCKALVFDSILNLLKLLTSPIQEIGDDPVLSGLRAWLEVNQEASNHFERVSVSLQSSGFHEVLRFCLSQSTPNDLAEDRLKLISDMAQRDIAMFFSSNPPIPDLPSVLCGALFPDDEREALFALLRSSPSALRALILAKDARSGSLSLASLQQTLPILARLFEIFAMTDSCLCEDGSRQKWAEEISIIASRLRNGPRPTPILGTLEARWRMDNEQRKISPADPEKEKKRGEVIVISERSRCLRWPRCSSQLRLPPASVGF